MFDSLDDVPYADSNIGVVSFVAFMVLAIAFRFVYRVFCRFGMFGATVRVRCAFQI